MQDLDPDDTRWNRGSTVDLRLVPAGLTGNSPSNFVVPAAACNMGRAGSNGPPSQGSSGQSGGRKATEPSPPPSIVPPPAQEGDSDSEEVVHPQQQNRTRQKKFVKNFKQLPSEEVVLQRYSCALMSDILLQGHLYVTENYIAFHSNVFGYVTRIQIPMISISSFTKEKTAKIIPNAIAVTTLEDTHTFTSFISREATYKVMTKAWRKALSRHNLANLNTEDLGDDDIDDIDEADGSSHHLDDESTDSMTSATNLDDILSLQKDLETKNPYLVKRLSGTGGLVFYQERTNLANGGVQGPVNQSGNHETTSKGWLKQLLRWTRGQSRSSLLLSALVLLLLLLLVCTLYLVLRLDNIQQKVDSALPAAPSSLEQLASWQSLLHTQSSRKVQEYLNTNLEQISKVRESLERLSQFLHSHDQRQQQGEADKASRKDEV